MSRSPAIQVEGLGKRYQRGTKRRHHDSLRDAMVDGLSSLFRRGPKDEAGTFWALRDASFTINHGENVGVIGLNGAGKSTLLKMLSRIAHPTTGRARIDGRLGALLEVGTGFHGDLTGRENTFLYGAILGMPREEIRRKFDAIVEFSGIEAFIDTPVKRYSSGMYVRLAFAVAAHLDPDILLLDEVLAVGDFAFQRKCMDFAKSLQQRDATILFVSHNMFSIKTMCERVIYLKKGQIQYDGPTDKGIELYEQDCRLATLPWVNSRPEEMPLLIDSCDVLDDKGEKRTVFDFRERLRIRIGMEARRPLSNLNVIVAITRSDGVICCNYTTGSDGFAVRDVEGHRMLELRTPPMTLVSELYSIEILVRDAVTQELLCGQIGSTFHIRHDTFDTHFGVFQEEAEWQEVSTQSTKRVAGMAGA